MLGLFKYLIVIFKAKQSFSQIKNEIMNVFYKLFIILIITTLLPFNSNADWVSVDKNKTASTPPEVTLLSDDNSSSVIKIDISGFELNEFSSKGKTYQSVDLLTEIFAMEAGLPSVPHIAKTLAIPDKAGISFEVLEIGEVHVFKNINLPPARKSWFEGEPETPYLENSEAYRSSSSFPNDYVSIDPPAVFRDFRIARVSVFPIRYKAAEKEIEVATSITVRINYGKSEVVNPKTATKKSIAPSFDKLYRSFLFNYQSVLDKNYNGKTEGHELMLCIMPDEFVESFQVYADWKRQSGTDIHITKFTDIGANANDPNIIKDHIADAYHNWEDPPTYVLIIGDNGIFPKKIVSYDYSFPNEDFFVEIDGDDYFPEMMIGRFTNQGDYRMRVMINKFEMYEKTPYIEETDWFTNAICCSNNAYESQVETKRFTANVMIEDGGFDVDTLMSNWGGGCTMGTSDVVNAFNDGRGFLNYRGEGWSSGWWASCYDIGTSTISSLNNGEKFTFVTSIGCGVSMFDAGGGNCFGEEWVQLGSLTSPRGGIAFVGPTSNTHTTYNNKIDKGIYVGLFQEGMDTPGQSLMRGKLYMYNVFGDTYWVEYQYRVFCVLGDPSIHIWKDVPKEVNVDHLSSINVGTNQLEITTTFVSNSLPVENAEVCITGEEIFLTSISDAEGKVYIDVEPEIVENLVVTVRGGNVYPYQGTIEIVQPEALVEPFGDPVIEDLDGNLDGLVNPNENCNITYALKNWGSLGADNVEATLTANPDYVEVLSTDPISFGDLSAGGESIGEPYQIFVKPECEVGQIIYLQLHITSNSGSWDYDLPVEIRGCKLMISNFLVSDESSPNPNYKMDSGESANLFLSLENYGDDIAQDVIANLTSNDPYVTISDAEGDFGAIDANTISINHNNYFEVSVNSSCPTNYFAEFSVELNTQNGNYQYHTVLTFNLPIGLSVPTDYTGPDEYGYFAYSSDDSFFEQTPEYNWFELYGIGTPIANAGNSDYTETVTLPFTFKYYGLDYTNLRISTDGWIAFGSGTQTAPLNTVIPNNDNVISMAAVFWDDLFDEETMEGDILYYDDEANHRFVIQWDSIAHNNNVGEPDWEVFQAILLDPTYYPTTDGNGEMIFQYKSVEDIESITIGIENNIQSIGLQYLFDTDYDETASNLSNDYAIKFTTEAPYLSVITSDEGGVLNSVPNEFELSQNHPNPFKSNTWISYSLPEKGNVRLTIYDLTGELICTLQNGSQLAGKHSIKWNGLNDLGNEVSPGIYFYNLKAESFMETKKLFKLK